MNKKDILICIGCFFLFLLLVNVISKGNYCIEGYDGDYPWFDSKEDKHNIGEYECTCPGNGKPATGPICVAHSSFVPVVPTPTANDQKKK